MQARMMNPVMILPGAMAALQAASSENVTEVLRYTSAVLSGDFAAVSRKRSKNSLFIACRVPS